MSQCWKVGLSEPWTKYKVWCLKSHMLTISWAFLLDTVKSQHAVRIHFQLLSSAVNKCWSEMQNRLTGANTSNLPLWGSLLFVVWKALRTWVPSFVLGSWWFSSSHRSRTWKETKEIKISTSPHTQRCLSRNCLGLETRDLNTCHIFCFCPFFSPPAFTLPSNLGVLLLRGFEMIFFFFNFYKVQNPMTIRVARGLQSTHWLLHRVRGYCSHSKKKNQ